MTMAPTPFGSPGAYENYPTPRPSGGRRPETALAIGRGTLVGMAAAVVTIIAVLPPSIVRPEEPALSFVLLIPLYAVAAAVVGALPGALVGGLLSALARAGATSLPIRLVGGVAAAAAAAVVSTPLQLASWPGTVVAVLCGAFAAPAVAWGPYRPTLD